MIFFSQESWNGVYQDIFFSPLLCITQEVENFVSKLFFLLSLGTGIFLAAGVSRSVLLMSRGAQLLICYCRGVHEHEHNVVRTQRSQWCCLLTPKRSTLPPGMKSSTSKTPQMLPCPAQCRAFPCSCRMGTSVPSPAAFLQATSLPQVMKVGQRFTSTEKCLREVKTQGLEDSSFACLIGNDFPHSLRLTSAIDINYDN